MAALIDAPVNSLPSTGLRAMVGAGITYTGLESLSDSPRWLQGWQFETGPCGTVMQHSGICTSARSFLPAPRKPQSFAGYPITTETQINCSTYADMEDLKKYARDEFERALFADISDELWSGTQARALNAVGGSAYTKYAGNRWLARDDSGYGAPVLINGGTAMPIGRAIAELDAYIGCASKSGNNLIHVPSKVLSYAGQKELLLDPVGDRRFTVKGTGVVSDCGYAGTAADDITIGPVAPAAGTAWIYATGPMFIKVAADFEGIDNIDIAQNDMQFVIPAAYAYGWGCGHAAALVNLEES